MRSSSHKLKQDKFHLNMRKNIFTLRVAAGQRGRGVSLFRDIQNPPGHAPVSAAQVTLPWQTISRFCEGVPPHSRGHLDTGLSWNTRTWSPWMKTILTTLFSSSLLDVLIMSMHLRGLNGLLAAGASRTRCFVQSRCDLTHLMPHPKTTADLSFQNTIIGGGREQNQPKKEAPPHKAPCRGMCRYSGLAGGP